MLLFDATHHHAEMAGFNDHADALRIDGSLDGFSNLCGHALLNLQAARENLDQPGNLAESNNSSVRNIGDVHLAEEWQHVMLTQAEHLNVFDDHHLVVSNSEQG